MLAKNFNIPSSQNYDNQEEVNQEEDNQESETSKPNGRKK